MNLLKKLIIVYYPFSISFQEEKFHFLIRSIGGGFSRVLSTGNTALAFQNSSIVGQGEHLTVPETCIAVPAPPLVALYL